MKFSIIMAIFILLVAFLSPGINAEEDIERVIETNIIKITDDSFMQAEPDIWENGIVWTDFRNDSDLISPENSDIYHYDISTGKISQISSNLSKQKTPKIHQSKIVWEDWRTKAFNEGASIYYIKTPIRESQQSTLDK